MAKIIYEPRQHHDCSQELTTLDTEPPLGGLQIGTIAECSCGFRWKKVEHQWDGTYWIRYTQGDKKSRRR